MKAHDIPVCDGSGSNRGEDPANPCLALDAEVDRDGRETGQPLITGQYYGLTIREHFAASVADSVAIELESSHNTIARIALELGIEPHTYCHEKHWDQFVAKRVVRRADALIAELAKVQP